MCEGYIAENYVFKTGQIANSGTNSTMVEKCHITNKDTKT